MFFVFCFQFCGNVADFVVNVFLNMFAVYHVCAVILKMKDIKLQVFVWGVCILYSYM
jgi:hypothetical protein